MRVALTSVLLSSVAAGQVFTVGPPGSGADFAQVQPAIDASASGATIVVSPGTYAPFTVDKALRVLGPGPALAKIDSTTQGGPAIRVTGVELGGVALVSGFDTESLTGDCGPSTIPFVVVLDDCNPVLEVEENPGTVVLHDLRVEYRFIIGHDRSDALHVIRSDHVVVEKCELEGASGTTNQPSRAVRVWDSALALLDSSVRGGSGTHGSQAAPGEPAVRGTGSVLYVAGSEIRGGTGGSASGIGVPFGGALPGATGISLEASVAKLVGGFLASVSGGTGGASFGTTCADGGVGVELSNASYVLTSTGHPVTGGSPGCFVASAGADWQADAGSVFDEIDLVYPTLRASAPRVATGGSFDLDLEGEASSVAALFVALDLGPGLILPGFDGALSLDAFSLAPLGGVALDASGAGSSTLNVPANPNLANRVLVFQTLNVGAQLVGFSNPTTVVTQ